MKLIDKYLLKTFLAPLAYCLVAFVMVYVIYDLCSTTWATSWRARPPSALVLQYYLILMPSVLTRIVPISLLLAALYALSSLTKNNEITAMRACGISITRLMVPFISGGPAGQPAGGARCTRPSAPAPPTGATTSSRSRRRRIRTRST
jgi:lipopolysaccharide export system permease protein